MAHHLRHGSEEPSAGQLSGWEQLFRHLGHGVRAFTHDPHDALQSPHVMANDVLCPPQVPDVKAAVGEEPMGREDRRMVVQT